MRDLELFAQAIEIEDPEKRARFVLAACGTDDHLRMEVQRLLASYAVASKLLEDSPAPEGFAAHLAAIPEFPDAEICPVTGPPPILNPDPTRSPTSSLIGPYKLLEKIGEGGFGQVFVAEQTQPIHRKVALKLIKPGMDSREVIARFSAERQALAMMDHPNIAKVLDGGTTEWGLPYFVMELVRGVPITDYCNRVGLDVSRRLALFVDCCKAIQHAHQKGIIHRDIKPNNVMVTLHDGEPVVKVIDFGVAKALNQRLTDITIYTRFSFMIGTPAYMSPEQAELSGLDIDTRSDIYSLGVLLYELIAGSPPFEPERFAKATIDEMRKILREEDPPRPSMRVGSLDKQSSSIAQQRNTEPYRLSAMLQGDLDWIVMKTLAKDRSRRYETANGLALDVQRFLDGKAVTARPPSWSYLTSRFLRRHRSAVLAVSFVLVTLVLGTIVSLALAFWALKEQRLAHSQRRVAVEQSKRASQETKRAAAAETSAHENLLQARLAFSRVSTNSRRPGQQFATLEAIREAVALARRLGTLDEHLVDLRSQAIAALTRVDVKAIQSLPLSNVAYHSYAISADFQRYAFRIRDGDRDFVSVRAAKSPSREDSRVRISFDTRAQYHDSANFLLSPDGRYLAIHTGEATPLEVWDLQTATRSLRLEGVPSQHGLDFSPDSRRLAVIQFDPTSQRDLAHIRSLPSGALEKKVDRTARKFLRFSPKGNALAVSTRDGFLIYDAKSNGLLADVPLPEDVLGYPVAWSASGKLLATGDNRCIRIWELDRIRRQYAASRTIDDVELNQALSTTELDVVSPSAILHGHESHVHWLMFHPQADFLLASHSWDRTTRLWNVFTGREQLVMPHGPPRFSRDGACLAVARADALDLYDLCLGDRCQWIYGNGQRAQQMVFDPEGKWIGLGTKTGCHLWSLPTLRPLTTLPGQSAYALALDGDRQSLLVGSDYGLFRWPMKVNASSLSVGPARMLLPTVANSFTRVLAPCQGNIAAAMEWDGWAPTIFDLESGTTSTTSRNTRVHDCSLSPNGRWLALCSTGVVEILDLPTRNITATLPVVTRAGVEFSPDSSVLAITNHIETQFIDTTTWSPTGRYAPSLLLAAPGFSPDGSLLAIPQEIGVLGLVRVRDQQLLARLPYSDPPSLFVQCQFSVDGSYLAASHESRGAAVWRLGPIRQELGDLGLDWDDAPLPLSPEVPSEELAQVRIEPGQLRGAVEIARIASNQNVFEKLEQLKSVIEDGVEIPDEYVVRARLWEQLGDFNAAIDDWQEALSLAPHADAWRVQYAMCLQFAGKLRMALAEYQRLWDSPFQTHATNHFLRIFGTAPTEFAETETVKLLLRRWEDALSGENPSSREGLAVGLLGSNGRQELMEAMGLAYFGLGDYTTARTLLMKSDGTWLGAAYALAIMHAEAGELALAKERLAEGINLLRKPHAQWYSIEQIRFYDVLQHRAERLIRELEGPSPSEKPAEPTELARGAEPISPTIVTFDSLDLIRSAQAREGRVWLQPNHPQNLNVLQRDIPFSEKDFLFWSLYRPDREITFTLPVPAPGRYRVSGFFAKASDYGNFVAWGNGHALGEPVNGYYLRTTTDQPTYIRSEELVLGEIEAKPRKDTTLAMQSPWFVELAFRIIGRHEDSTRFCFGLDNLKFARIE